MSRCHAEVVHRGKLAATVHETPAVLGTLVQEDARPRKRLTRLTRQPEAAVSDFRRMASNFNKLPNRTRCGEEERRRRGFLGGWNAEVVGDRAASGGLAGLEMLARGIPWQRATHGTYRFIGPTK